MRYIVREDGICPTNGRVRIVELCADSAAEELYLTDLCNAFDGGSEFQLIIDIKNADDYFILDNYYADKED